MVLEFPLDEERVVAAKRPALVTLNTGNTEWYTPAEYIESARTVLGGIDLDPASNPVAQETVRAATYYTVEDDGLSNEWAGKVCMNPPYTAHVINDFMDKLTGHFASGEVSEAIVLTNNNTDTSWFHSGVETASAICFTRGRISFYGPEGQKTSPTNGQCFFYFGRNSAAFIDEFSRHGKVIPLSSTPRVIEGSLPASEYPPSTWEQHG